MIMSETGLKYSFRPAVRPPADQAGPALWLLFRRSELLVEERNGVVRLPQLETPAPLGATLLRNQYLGTLAAGGAELPCYAGELSEAEPPPGMHFYGLRQLFGRLPDPYLGLAGRAVQIIDWDRTHRYCGRCGTPVEQQPHERAKQCPACGLTSYPRLSPAMIVSVERPSPGGTELLLARNNRHPSGFYSVLAGFVEPGESLEECVRREVCEEVGLEIKNIRYFGSQPWPFPNSLMIAFTADYASGTIEIEEEELASAGWFSADAMPPVPPPASIARQLIDAFVARNTLETRQRT